MLFTADPVLASEPLLELRRLRAAQAWTLMAVSAFSIALGVALIRATGNDARATFTHAVGWQFVIWGAIDAIFATMGVVQSIGTARRPIVAQTEADEFAAGEKLLRSLQFNHRLNIAYLVTAALLLAWAVVLKSPSLAGHGAGVLLQGGFLFVFDLIYIGRYARLMGTP
ncbi:MAG TPA: hypothetical protein VF595_05825 [Tepidisphaeraceae bacterium]|jgi:hypothetical protein